MRRHGYIMVEAVMAIALLSVGTVAIQGALRQAIITRGQAKDYTQVKFLLEQLISELEIQPLLKEGEKQGTFPGDSSRFSWKTRVRKINLPDPTPPSDLDPSLANSTKLQIKYLTYISATVYWQRAGRKFQESFETLWLADKLLVKKKT
jgi:hypothetical protein